ncbi:MAG TPA: hypothetical protein DF427_03615 [Moraxellaceae bacterium]|nr:hypothetical protein [Moraxellaceae bacterium]
MKSWLITLLVCLLVHTGSALATSSSQPSPQPSSSPATPDRQSGEQLLQRYFTALQKHDLRALDSMITGNAPFKVEWQDSTPPKHFTMTRHDYLQQVRATWHFGKQEQLDMSKVEWQAVPASKSLLARFRLRENRIILGTATGQESDIELQLLRESGVLKISRIHARTRTW